jgi:hypothetical protein
MVMNVYFVLKFFERFKRFKEGRGEIEEQVKLKYGRGLMDSSP